MTFWYHIFFLLFLKWHYNFSNFIHGTLAKVFFFSLIDWLLNFLMTSFIFPLHSLPPLPPPHLLPPTFHLSKLYFLNYIFSFGLNPLLRLLNYMFQFQNYFWNLHFLFDFEILSSSKFLSIMKYSQQQDEIYFFKMPLNCLYKTIV